MKLTYRERKALKEQKEKEREKKKKLKEKEKKKAETKKRILKKKREKYKPIHIKNLRKRQNKRAYKKRRKKELEEHKLKGDVQGYYRIMIMKNHQFVKELSHSWWMLTAYEKFNKYIEDNNKGVICEKILVQSQNGYDPLLNEILLLKKIDPTIDNGVREIRNEYGIFEENIILDNNNYAIIAKDKWFIPETYHVYGFNPITDRKTGRWIYDNLINKDCSKENLKLVYMCHNKLIIQYNNDIDLVICNNDNECLRLYNKLEQETPKKNKYVMYTAYIADSRISWLYDLIQEKTGWNRNMIIRNKN
jgi:hypothetical protein